MKYLVLSDSHSSLSFMRRCVDAVKPDGILHLGDHYDDGETLAEDYPHIRMYQVPGNCDRYRCPPWVQEIRIENIAGATVYMTHGHKHGVKMDIGKLLSDARKAKAEVVLYGHTHIPNCYREPDGLWVLNPGSCGYYGGSAGILVIEDGKVRSCHLIRQEELEEFA
jgi:putative phosphoesterase